MGGGEKRGGERQTPEPTDCNHCSQVHEAEPS